MNPTRKKMTIRVMVGLLALSATTSPLTSFSAAQTVTPLTPASPTQMTTISASQLQAMLDATKTTVISQARAQGIPESQIAQLESQLGGLMTQASSLVQEGSPDGSVQIPTQALQALAMNMQQAAGGSGMSAQGMSAQGLSLPSMPSFLGDGGLDTIINYLINGLATAVSMIPVVGPPLAEILKQIGGSMASFLINNGLADGVMEAINGAQQYWNQLQQILGMADLNKLLGAGTDYVSNRLNGVLGGGGVTADPTTPAGIQTAVEQAKDSGLKGLQATYSTMLNNDPYQEMTGVSKYVNPLTAVGQMTNLMGQLHATRLTNKSLDATGASLTSLAVSDEIIKTSTDNVNTAMTQSTMAKTGVASATTALGAMKIQTGLLGQMNNLNAMNASLIVQSLKQVVASTDANTQVSTAMLEDVIQKRKENAAIASQQTKRLEDSNIQTANQAAGSVSSLRHMTKLSTLSASEFPMVAPYGEEPFLK